MNRLWKRCALPAALLLAGLWLWGADVTVPVGSRVSASRDPTDPLTTVFRCPASTGYQGCFTSVDDEPCSAVSQDGRVLAWAIRDWPPSRSPRRDMLVLWDLVAMREIGHAVPPGHPSACALSPDGSVLVSALAPAASSLEQWRVGRGSLGFWDARTGRRLRLIGLDGYALALAFTPDGKSVLAWVRNPTTADAVEKVMVWDLASGRCVRVLPHSPAWPREAASSADGRTVALAAEDGQGCTAVVGYDTRTWAALWRCRGLGPGMFTSIALSPVGSKVAATTFDFRGPGAENWIVEVAVWDTRSGKRLYSCRLAKDVVVEGSPLFVGEAALFVGGWGLDLLSGGVESVSLFPVAARWARCVLPGGWGLFETHGWPRMLEVWDLNRGVRVRRWRNPPDGEQRFFPLLGRSIIQVTHRGNELAVRRLRW